MSHREADHRESPTQARAVQIIGPTGEPMTRDDLPPPGISRWVVRRKAEVVAGVRGGLISLSEACRRYNLSEDEFRSWQRLFDDHGMAGLRATNVKKFRRTPPSANCRRR